MKTSIKKNSLTQAAQGRHEDFMAIFRNFDTIDEGAEWIAKVTMSSKVSVMAWRSCHRGTIPPAKWALTQLAAKRKFRNAETI
jgi:hypothetical protein